MWILLWLGLSACSTSAIPETVTGLAGAEKATKSMLVTANQLHQQLSGKDLRILDVRARGEYMKGHIPGAVRVDVSAWKKLAAARKGLHDTKGWGETVGSLGIGEGTHVVVYGGRISNAARIWWLLKYVGVKNVALLDGGWEQWRMKNRPVERTLPKISGRRFSPKFQADRLAEIDSVKRSLKSKSLKLVDTRSDAEFARGRIPQSVHLEWKHLLGKDGRFKTREQLRELFRKKKILHAETAVCY